MPYMFFQPYTTAVNAAFAGRDDISEQYAKAKACREWLETLEIDPKLLNPLVEPVAAIEDALMWLQPDYMPPGS